MAFSTFFKRIIMTSRYEPLLWPPAVYLRMVALQTWKNIHHLKNQQLFETANETKKKKIFISPSNWNVVFFTDSFWSCPSVFQYPFGKHISFFHAENTSLWCFLSTNFPRKEDTKHFSTLFKTLAPRRQVARETKVLRQNDLVFSGCFSSEQMMCFSQLRRHPKKPREKWW